jgi:serine/threonine-protein kinase
MKFFDQLRAGRHIQKLRTARSMSPEAVKELVEQLVLLGTGAIEPVMECLGHGEARDPAQIILLRLLDNSTLPLYLEALSSTNPAVASGVAQVLSRGKGYDISKVVDLLSDPSIPKARVESILWEQVDSISPRTLASMVPELDKDARATVFRLLEKTASETTLPDMISLIGHDEWSVRINVARFLGNYDTPDAIKGLIRLVKDDDKNVRLEAVQSLHKLRAPRSVPALVDRLRDTDLKIQGAAIDALVDFADASAVPALVEVLKDESEYARRGAVEVLNEVATTAAVQDLIRALRDADWWVRVRAADALGSLGGPRVVEGVVSLLDDSDDFMRRYAVEILNAVSSERAVLPLIRALQDGDWWVRERAIDALAKAGDPRAVEPLMDLLHQDLAAAPHCVRALGALGDTRALPVVAKLVDSDNDGIRSEAVQAVAAFSRGRLTVEERELVKETMARANVTGPLRPMAGSTPSSPAYGPEMGEPSPAPSLERAPLTIAGRDSPAKKPPPDKPAGEPAREPAPEPASPPASPSPVNFQKLERDAVLLDRFRVLRQIGKGGFGTIYLVEDSAIQEQIILKVLNPHLALDEMAIKRFVQELKLTRSITHPNVIRIYDFLDLGGARAVSMEYFPSKDLGKLIRAEKAIAPDKGLRILDQVCDGLAAAHSAGVVHRDIKPANILVGPDGNVKIVDFGLASVEQRMGSRLTKSGILIGTPEYMAPEQISGAEVGHRADIYALGILMYEMFTGVRPYTAETPVKILFQHLEGTPAPMTDHVPGIPDAVVALTMDCMAKEPQDRPPTAGDLQARIRDVLSGLAEAA